MDKCRSWDTMRRIVWRIGLYFFEDGEGHAVTVNSQRYVSMYENFLGPELARHLDNEDTFLQQDGATSHTSRVFMNIVRNFFPNHAISKNRDIPWPTRSPDLSACHFFLWVYLKSRVFQPPSPRNIQELKERIREEVARIPVAMLRHVMSNLRTTLIEYEPKWR
jgi:hypothetical protein